MANQVTLPTPPSALPPKITNVASAILHYDIIVAGAVTGSMAILGTLIPNGAEYAQWVLYALAVIAVVMKLAGATAAALTTMIASALFFTGCTKAQTAADMTVAECVITDATACDTPTEIGIATCIASVAAKCGTDVENAASLYAVHKAAIVAIVAATIDAGTDH